MIVNGLTLNANAYENVAKSSSGTLNVPVKPSVVVYSQLEHVNGTAATRGQRGVPLSKVIILNTLIDQLVNMKNSPKAVYDKIYELTDSQKDALIKDYQKQIQLAVAQSASNYGLAGAMPEPGALFTISA